MGAHVQHTRELKPLDGVKELREFLVASGDSPVNHLDRSLQTTLRDDVKGAEPWRPSLGFVGMHVQAWGVTVFGAGSWGLQPKALPWRKQTLPRTSVTNSKRRACCTLGALFSFVGM